MIAAFAALLTGQNSESFVWLRALLKCAVAGAVFYLGMLWDLKRRRDLLAEKEAASAAAVASPMAHPSGKSDIPDQL